MRRTVVIINGRGGVGKDSVCEIVAKHYHTAIVSTIDDVKEAARHIGWEGGKELKDRAFLSDLKDLCSKYYDHPFKKAVNQYEQWLSDNYYDVLFIHVREPEEIEKLRKHIEDDGKARVITLLIDTSILPTASGNHADDEVGNYDYDFLFINDCDLDDLEEEFMGFWKQEVITERQGEFGHFAKLEKENEKLKARCEEYRIRIRELEKSNEEIYLRGRIEGLEFSTRCNGVSGDVVRK